MTTKQELVFILSEKKNKPTTQNLTGERVNMEC